MFDNVPNSSRSFSSFLHTLQANQQGMPSHYQPPEAPQYTRCRGSFRGCSVPDSKDFANCSCARPAGGRRLHLHRHPDGLQLFLPHDEHLPAHAAVHRVGSASRTEPQPWHIRTWCLQVQARVALDRLHNREGFFSLCQVLLLLPNSAESDPCTAEL